MATNDWKSNKVPTKEQAMATTMVFWDMQRCPVPSKFDAHLVGPCIKNYLKKLGYGGPISIDAIGPLTDVSDTVLGAIMYTGIVCHAVAYDASTSVISSIFEGTFKNPPPSNILVFTDPSDKSLLGSLYMLNHEMGHNIIFPYHYGPKKAASDPWRSFLRAESEALLEEDYYCKEETPACWVCAVCTDFTSPGYFGDQGFRNLTKHLSSEKHASELFEKVSCHRGNRSRSITSSRSLSRRERSPLRRSSSRRRNRSRSITSSRSPSRRERSRLRRSSGRSRSRSHISFTIDIYIRYTRR